MTHIKSWNLSRLEPSNFHLKTQWQILICIDLPSTLEIVHTPGQPDIVVNEILIGKRQVWIPTLMKYSPRVIHIHIIILKTNQRKVRWNQMILSPYSLTN
jgi:hypothetical protein